MKQRILNDEEKELWDEFSKSTKPLRLQNKRNKKPSTIKTTKPKNHDLNKITSNVTDVRPNTKIIKDDKHTPSLRMDAKLHNKLKQGKLRPQAKLDLHGLNLAQAQSVLTKFVLSSYDKGFRLILVITGKGRNTENNDIIPRRVGILKANFPNWLAIEPLSSKILQITEAHVRHGGGGAFYVYLKKKK